MIEVGEYVRTYQGDIGKVATVTSTGIIIEDERHIHFDRITKHSKNIIDLIEVGDYLNGHRVRCVYLEGKKHYIKLENFDLRVYDEEIKSVVTSEQFETMKYKVEE